MNRRGFLKGLLAAPAIPVVAAVPAPAIAAMPAFAPTLGGAWLMGQFGGIQLDPFRPSIGHDHLRDVRGFNVGYEAARNGYLGDPDGR